MVGQRCVWNTGYPKLEQFKGLQNRVYDILSITLTHVYIRNVRNGFRKNVPIDDFKNNYEVHVMKQEELV